MFHPIGGSAGIGDNLGDGIITNFGDNLCDDFATICFTQYGDFFVDLPEMVTGLTGLLEVFIFESFILATVSDNSVRYQAINVVKK